MLSQVSFERVDLLSHLLELLVLLALVEVLGCLGLFYFLANCALHPAEDTPFDFFLFIIRLYNKGSTLPLGDLLLHGCDLLGSHVLLLILPFAGHLCTLSSLAHSVACLGARVRERLMPDLHAHARIVRCLLVRLGELFLVPVVDRAKPGFAFFFKGELWLFGFLLLLRGFLLLSGIVRGSLILRLGCIGC